MDEIRFHPLNVRVDLGDLRALAESINRFGVIEPVVVERYGGLLRLRAGHRRVAASVLAGRVRIPAVIHGRALDDQAWILHSVQENVKRRQLAAADRRKAVVELRRLGCSWARIADAFGVTAATAAGWATESAGATAARRPSPRVRATRRLVAEHRGEFDRLLSEERGVDTVEAEGPLSRDEVVAEVERLVGTDSLTSIVRRLGYTRPGSLARSLHRWGRPDLGRRFDRLEAAA